MSPRDAQFRALYAEQRLGAQRAFYLARSEEYRRAHDQAIVLRTLLLVLAAAAGVAGQFWTSQTALLGVAAALLAALAGALTGYEALMGFEQVGKLYADAELSVAEAELNWQEVTVQGDLGAEVERSELIFRTENGQWGQLVPQSRIEHPKRPEL